MTFLLALVLAQDPIRELVEKLGADSLDEREAAAAKLREIGKPALPELEKAARSPDAERAARAQYLIRVIPLREFLTPELLRLMPGVEERLLKDDLYSWTRAFLDVDQIRRQARLDGGSPQYTKAALEGLAPFALAGATSAEDKSKVLFIIQDADLRSALPGVAKLLEDSDPKVRMSAVCTLGLSSVPEARAALPKALRDTEPTIQCQAVKYLVEGKAVSAAPDLAALLESPSAHVRGVSIRALGTLGAAAEVRRIAERLDDPAPTVRYFALRALVDLEFREGSPRIRKRLEDDDPGVRAAAIRACAALEGTKAEGALREFLDDRFPLVRMAAADELCRLGAKAAVPVFLKLWDEQAGYQGRELRLDSLNGVRQPELWARLSGLRLQGPLGATVEEARKALEKAAGVPVDWGGPESRYINHPAGQRLPLTDAAGDLAPLGMQMILEADRVRFVSQMEAVEFWTAWGRR